MAKILIVDDSRVTRNLVGRILSQLHHRYDEAPDGAEGLRRARVSPYDLIITDLNMPNLDGLDFIARIREFQHHLNTTILVLTTESAERQKQLARKYDVAGWMTKPFESSELKRAVGVLLKDAAA